MKKKMKEIQENNPKLFSWIVGGIAGWTVTAISIIIYLLVNQKKFAVQSHLLQENQTEHSEFHL